MSSSTSMTGAVPEPSLIELSWIRENPSYWDEDKRRIIESAEAGSFTKSHLERYASGPVLPGSWWRVECGGRTVGYGWMDVTWGDAEILLAVDPHERRRGIGNFILDCLEAEARSRGLNYLHNVVPNGHPRSEVVSAWLRLRGFAASEDGRLLRAVVRAS